MTSEIEEKPCWCPYLGEEISSAQASKEHIIPLCLGGSNEFVISVEKNINSELGSKVDGKLANEFLTSIRRLFFGAQGQSGKKPIARLKNSRIKETDDPVQIIFTAEEIVVWDAKRKKKIEFHELGETAISSKFTIDRFSRLRIISKVALASGYFIYGDLFRTSFNHKELRSIMHLDAKNPDEYSKFAIRFYDEFSDVNPRDYKQVLLDKNFCKSVRGSCVMTIPGQSSVGFVVGILGQWIGTANVPANTDQIPFEGDHDLGHVIRIDAGKMRRLSYRKMASEALEVITADETEAVSTVKLTEV